MSVYQKKGRGGRVAPNYWYDFVVDGQRYRGNTGVATRDEALEIEAAKKLAAQGQLQAKDAVRAVHRIVAKNKPMTLAEAIERWAVRRKARCSKRVLEEHINHWRQFMAYCETLPGRPALMCDIDDVIAQGFLLELREGKIITEVHSVTPKRKKPVVKQHKRTPLAPSTQNKYRTTCKAVFRELQDITQLGQNPFEQTAQIHNDHIPRERFSEADLQVIAENPHPQLADLISILLHTGLRTKDAVFLRWEQVNLAKRRLEVVAHKTRHHGSSAHPAMPPINDTLLQLFGRIHAEGADDRYVLPAMVQAYYENPTKISARFARYIDSLGIKRMKYYEGHGDCPVKTLHSFRHTFVSRAADNGVPLTVVKKWVGHMTASMTKHYTARADEITAEQWALRMPK